MSEKIKIVGVIASEYGATLITIDGKSIELKSSDYRTHEVIAQITPIIALHKVAEINLETFDVTKAVERKTEGKVRFFRVLTEKVKSLFGLSAERQIDSRYNDGFVGAPVSPERAIQSGVVPLSNAEITNLEKVNQSIGTANTTLVAVVDNTPIIGAEALEKQIEAAARQEGRPVGFELFMQRLAAVARERKHTAQELLDFLRLADLPIADDGCIVGYKALRVQETDGVRTFFDHHTGRVPQRVGSKVQMPVEKVDDNRRVLCSNGLHIARRKYLTSYGSHGTVTLTKIAPEDVISVPMGEPDKMRCAAYHIVAELPSSAHAFIRSNQPMTKNIEAQTILGNVIKGNHIGVIETVEIRGSHGTDVHVTRAGAVEPEVKLDGTVRAKVLDDETVTKLNPAALNAQVEQIIETDRQTKIAEPEAPTADPAPVAAPAKPKKAKSAKKSVKIDMTPDQKRAVKLVKGGMSKREAERETGVSARTIGRLLDKLAA